MSMKHQCEEKMTQLKCCVLVPTYNNERTLEQVLNGVLEYVAPEQLIVVNDGATDSTPEILAKFPEVFAEHFPQNQGKGMALREGFRIAVECGFDYAISIDSDGQHMPSDIPAFLEKIEQEPDSVIVGARNMDQDSVPGKSSFGHKFSNFWYRFETHIDLPDTQSGYRLYPVRLLQDTKYITRKFEFEIEVLVRAAWKGLNVTSIPVQVHYATGEDRVTHFRPFEDFTRISILNTCLVTLAILYYKPLLWYRAFKKKSLREHLKSVFLKPEETALNAALSVAFGLFMGIVPIWGWQLAVAIPMSYALRLNTAIVVLSAHISIPPMIPVLVYLSLMMGNWLTGSPMELSFDWALSLEDTAKHLYTYILGACAFAGMMALLGGFFSYPMLKVMKAKSLAQG